MGQDFTVLEGVIQAISQHPHLEDAAAQLGWTYEYLVSYLGRPEITVALDSWRRARQNALLLRSQFALENGLQRLRDIADNSDENAKDRVTAIKELSALSFTLDEHTDLGQRLGTLEKRVRQAILSLPEGEVPELDELDATERRIMETLAGSTSKEED